ncbi:MAG TPA: DUF4129 domain-containing protein [Herpetosiphonaceae bacterium]
MRNVRFNLWQMLLVVALVLGTVTAVLSGIQAVLPQLQLPWLLPLLALTAIDAVITQRVAARERLSLGEQGALRGVELTLLVVAIRLASLSAEGTALSAVLQPWLRDPLAFFGGYFATYVWPTLITWGLGTTLAQAVLAFETELPREGVRSLPNEEAAVIEDRVLALAHFDRYWLICTLVALGGAVLALYQMPLVLALQQWTTARPVVAVFACLVAGLVLHSQGQLDRLRYGWQIEQASVDSDVPRRWRRASGLLIVSACVVGLLLSQGTLWVPPPPLVPVINALLVIAAFIVSLLVALFGLLLFPFIWLLSLLVGNSPPSGPIFRPIPPPQIAAPPAERPLLPALIFWACIALLIGMALLRYVQQRQELRVLLMRWRGVRWLVRIFGVAWHDLQSWSALAVQTIQRRLRRSRRLPSPRITPPAGSQAQLRLLYQRMVRSAERRGIAHPRSQTPYEFRAALGSAVPPADADVSSLTDVYVAAEYGPQPAQPGDVRRARKHWRRIRYLIGRSHRSIDPLRLRRRRNK